MRMDVNNGENFLGLTARRELIINIEHFMNSQTVEDPRYSMTANKQRVKGDLVLKTALAAPIFVS